MGCGLYDYSAAESRATVIKSASREQIFKSRSLDPEMNIKGKIRECCETTEHPNTLPIIIALDVTGSMGRIPEVLIKTQLPTIVKAIQDAGIQHPEICFCAVGDDVYDQAPIQVGQFESSDELIEKWLIRSWLEGGGGANNGESYCLAHYFAAYHTKCDAFARGQKGVLITIGDERYLPKSSKHTIKSLFGDDVQNDIEFDAIIDECSKNWNVFHININDLSSQRQNAKEQWEQLLGGSNVKTIAKTSDMEELVPAIVSCITSTSTVVSSTTSTTVETTTTML